MKQNIVTSTRGRHFREGATAEIATAISDFPTIGNRELVKYMEWRGFNLSRDSIVTIAASVRTSLNINLIGNKRRKHLSADGKAHVRQLRKKAKK